MKLYPEGTEVGICGVFCQTMVNYIFGKNAKGSTYKYDWDKIKVGDTIEGDNHIFLVMAKDDEYIDAAESNESGDKLSHYGRTPLDKETLDELSKKGKMRYTFTTYYSATEKAFTDIKPQKAKVSVKSTEDQATVKLSKTKGAVGYCIYMSNSQNGEYKKIKTIKAEKELKYIAKDLSAGDYYFKAMAYRNVNGKKVWGAYSDVVKCTVAAEAK